MIDRKRWGITIGQMLEARIAAGQAATYPRPMPAPGSHASDEAITAAQDRLGFALDAQHAALLREIDGWPELLFGVGDLLPTADLGQGPRWKAANELLDIMYQDGPTDQFPPREEVYPLHAGDLDVIVIWRTGPLTDDGHPVYWLAGDVVDQWPNVFGYCLGTIALNQVLINAAKRGETNRHP